jgi:hypothetical protein
VIPFKSSNLESGHYDSATRRLTIKFKSGGSWHYADVDQKHWEAMQKADSVGGYFHKHIKSAHKAVREDN